VSSQNLRNAQAIDKNIEALISVSDMSVKFTVNRIWVQDNVTLIDNLLNERRSYKQASDPGKTLRTKIDDEAKRLIEILNEKPAETKEGFIQKERLRVPLAAAAAFDEGVTSEIASVVADEVYNIYRSDLLEGHERQLKAQATLSQFKTIQENKEVKDDILESYEFLRSVILEQKGNYVDLASQLDSAAQGGASAATILRGVTENQTLIESIATVVLNRTNNEKRAKAARELLERVKKE